MPSLNDVILKPPTLLRKRIIWRVCFKGDSETPARDADPVGLEWDPDGAAAVSPRPHFKELLFYLLAQLS